MSEKKLNKTLSILIVSVLVLGLIGPVAETVGDSENLQERESTESNEELTSDEDDLVVKDGETRNLTSDDLRDGNVIVRGEGSHLRIINSTLTLRQDSENQYNVTVDDGGKLSLYNGTINTWRSGEDIIQPFFKTEVIVRGESKLLLEKNSAFSFPGFVYILESELEMIDSEFKALEEVPDSSDFDDYDYLWNDGDSDVLADNDNKHGPRLIARNNSKVYMENSRIEDYYNLPNDDEKDMIWYPLEEGEPIEELQEENDHIELEEGDSLTIEEWFLSNPMVPDEKLEEYPFINPIDQISALEIEIKYDTDDGYTGEGNLTYESPEEEDWIEVMTLDETPNDEEISTDVWEVDLREFFRDERAGKTRYIHDLNVTVNNEIESGGQINITELKLNTHYDNDIHFVDSDFTAINSFMDVNTKSSGVGTSDSEMYLQSYEMNYRSVRLYGDSSFRSYGLEIADDDEDTNQDPWILNTEESHDETWIYRWVNITVRTEEGGYPLPDAELDFIPRIDNETLHQMVNETVNDPTLQRNEDAWEYLNKTGAGEYDEEKGVYRTGEDGKVTAFLVSDRVNFPDDWPNGQFVGNYDVNVTYDDESWERSIDSLEDLMTMENPDDDEVVIPVQLPDLKAEDLWVEEEDEPIHPGDDVDLQMNVSNVGFGDAYNITVAFYQGEFDSDNPYENRFNSTELDRLNATESKLVNVTWEAEDDPDTYTIIGVVDPEDNITEKNRDNNEVELDIEVVHEPFFEVEIHSPEDGQEFVEGDEVEIDYSITNIGGAEVTQEITFWVNDTVEFEEDITLGAGDTYDDYYEWSPDEPGEYNLTLESEDDSHQVNITVLREAEFVVEIVEYDEEVVEGEDLEVVANITNEGEERTTQTIGLYDVDRDEEPLDEVDVELGENESEEITLTWETEVNEAGGYFLEVRSEDDEAGLSVTVLQQPFFQVTSVDAQDVVEGEEMEIDIEIENTGGQVDTQTIILYDEDDNELDYYEELTLNPDEDEEITLTWDTENYDAGDYTLRVASEDDEEEIDVTLIKAAEFTVEIDVEESDTEGVEGQNIVIYADIENIGEEDENVTQTINLYDDAGEVVDHQNVTLGPDDLERVNLTWETEFGDAGEYTLRVASDDDEDEIDVTLNPAPNLNFVTEIWEVDGDEIDHEEGFELEEGDTLTFEGQILNEGGASIFNPLVEYRFPDGKMMSETIEEVEPNEVVNVSATWHVRVIEDPEISIWVNSTDERTHDEIRYFEDDFEDIEPTVIRFEDLEFPEQEMIPGDSYHFGGRVVRDADDKPLADIEVTISLQSSPALISETVSTDENGEFSVFLTIPDGAAGAYTVEFEADTHEVQTTQQSVEVETDVLEVAGIPWWLLLVIVAIAAGGAGSAFAYFKFFGIGEMVECGNCGSTISADATSCPKCGVEFDMDTVKCSECGEWIPADLDVCPECGVEFVKTGKEVEDYTERMRKQYKKFVRKKKREAEEELGKEDLSQKEFMDWWKDKPSFVKFDEWLERKEKQRREGSIECPECGTLNSVDDAVCQKCGTSLIDLGEPEEEEESSEVFLEEEPTEEEPIEEELEEETFEEELEEEAEEEEVSEPQEDEDTLEEETEELEESTEEEKEKKVKKKPKKTVKKKVVKKSDDEED